MKKGKFRRIGGCKRVPDQVYCLPDRPTDGRSPMVI
jgi:hypothetical protein